jgi:hypothetical protein
MLQGGHKDAEHWGPYGPISLGPRDLPPQLKQMQPTGMDAQGDEGRRQALEAATVARAEGGDWSSIAQYLRESPAAGPLRQEERQMAERMSSISHSNRRRAEPFDARMAGVCASWVYHQENFARVLRKHPELTVG